jgi:hypothetical protein
LKEAQLNADGTIQNGDKIIPSLRQKTVAVLVWQEIGVLLGILESIDELRRKHDLRNPVPTLPSIREVENGTISPEEFLKQVEKGCDDFKDRVQSTQKSLSIGGSLKWVFRDQNRLANLVSELEDANQALRDLVLDSIEQEQVSRAFQATLLHELGELGSGVKSLGGRLDASVKAVEESQIAMIRALNDNQRILAQILPQAQVQRLRLAISPDDSFADRLGSVPAIEDYVKSHHLIHDISRVTGIIHADHLADSSTRWLAQLHTSGDEQIPVVVELKRQGSLGDDEFVTRNNELVSLLHASSNPSRNEIGSAFNVLQCLGYVNIQYDERDGARQLRRRAVCFIYEPPLSLWSSQASPKFESLFSWLSRKACPPLGARFQIAQSLLASYYNFLSTGWFHKGIRSHNIIFFQDGSGKPVIQPHLLGFEYSRPTKSKVSDKESEDDVFDKYRHPLYRENRETTSYRIEFDLYSLGIVLIELAYWLPVSHASFPTKNVLIDGRMLNREQKQLETQVGELYAAVVQSCIGGTLGVVNPSADRAQMIQRYSERVVKRVQMCKA